MTEQYIKMTDELLAVLPIEMTDTEENAILHFDPDGEHDPSSDEYRYRLVDIPDDFCTACADAILTGGGELQYDAAKKAARDLIDQDFEDNQVRIMWWEHALRGVGTPSIPTVLYLIDEGTASDDYPAILQKVKNSIPPTDAEWEAYNEDFVLP